MREDPRIEYGQQPRDFRMLDLLEELLVIFGVERVPSIFEAQWDDDFVEQGIAEARHLNPGSRFFGLSILPEDPRFLAARGSIDADHGARVARIRRIRAVPCEHRFRHLNRDAVDVYAAESINARSIR